MSDESNLQTPREVAVRVLVVEDEHLVALFLQDTLDELGFECCGVAHSADVALKLAESERPNVALVDIGLRGSRDGIALARELIGRLDVPVIFLTGSSDLETRRRAEEVRPRGFLTKPCAEHDIAAVFRSARLVPSTQ